MRRRWRVSRDVFPQRAARGPRFEERKRRSPGEEMWKSWYDFFSSALRMYSIANALPMVIVEAYSRFLDACQKVQQREVAWMRLAGEFVALLCVVIPLPRF